MAKKKKQTTLSWWGGMAVMLIGLLTFLSQMQLDRWTKPADQVEKGEQEVPTSPFDEYVPRPLPPAGNPDRISIASFNIQVFGQSKMSDAPVIERLADVMRHFDLIAIQEIRSKDQNLMPEFLKIVNSRGAKYRYLISERLGRTSSKEQYAYVYRSETIEPIPGRDFLIDDRQDLLHREPYVASFRTRRASGNPFTFTLINMHTDPDDASFETEQMALVYRFVNDLDPQEDDVIVLGDLNVDATKLGSLGQIPQIISVTGLEPTNTRRTAQYDHILVNRLTTSEYTGKAGVFDLKAKYKLTDEQTLMMSDHLPLWAEFSAVEQRRPTQLASPGSGAVTR